MPRHGDIIQKLSLLNPLTSGSGSNKPDMTELKFKMVKRVIKKVVDKKKAAW